MSLCAEIIMIIQKVLIIESNLHYYFSAWNWHIRFPHKMIKIAAALSNIQYLLVQLTKFSEMRRGLVPITDCVSFFFGFCLFWAGSVECVKKEHSVSLCASTFLRIWSRLASQTKVQVQGSLFSKQRKHLIVKSFFPIWPWVLFQFEAC